MKKVNHIRFTFDLLFLVRVIVDLLKFNSISAYFKINLQNGKECYRILKKGGTLICFYDLWKLSVIRDYFDK